MWLATLIATLSVLVVPDAASAAADPAKQRQDVKRQQAQSAAKLNAARASDREVRRALDAVAADVRAQEARSASAAQAAAAAGERLRRANAQAATVEARLDAVKDSARQIAVQAYMHGGTRRTVSAARTTDAMSFARSEFLRSSAMGSKRDLTDSLSATREDLEATRKVAESAALSASGRKRAAAGELAALRASRGRQAKLASAAEVRLERALAEADSLAQLDRRLAAEITARQRTYAGRIPANRASPSGSRPSGNVSLATVRGITVSTQIADQLERLLSAADGDGLRFGGSGHRSSDGQVAARRSNCGSSNYDVYDKPASQCSPPTARPGQSMHEQGLAIDFTHNGSLIQSRSSPGFQWLSRNASQFGLRNLPAEPWHWSTNGN